MAYGDVTPVGTIPSGTTPNGALEFDTTQGKTPVMAQVDSTHVLVCWSGAGDDGFAQVMLDDGDGNWSAVGTALEFDTVRGGRQGDLIAVDSNHFLHVYSGSGSDGFAVILEVNLSTFAVTNYTALEFDTVNFGAGSVCQLDSTHYLTAYAGAGDDGFATVLAVNTGTWAVTEASASKLEWLDATTVTRTHLLPISSSRALLIYEADAAITGASIIYAQTLAVNTGTWAVTTTGTGVNLYNPDLTPDDPVVAASTAACWLNGSTTHALVAWSEAGEHYFRVVALDGSYNATAVAAAVDIPFTSAASIISVAHIADDAYVAVGWGAVASSDAHVHILDVDSGTYAVTATTTNTQVADDSVTAAIEGPCDLLVTASTRFTIAYEWAGNDGHLQSFSVDLTSTQQVTPAVIADPATVNAPQVNLHVAVGVIADPATVNAPAVVSGQTITAPVIADPATVHAPLIGAGLLQPDTLNDPATVHTPTIQFVVSPSTITAPATVNAPTQLNFTIYIDVLRTDERLAECPVIETVCLIYEPALVYDQNISFDLIDAVEQVFAPVVSQPSVAAAGAGWGVAIGI